MHELVKDLCRLSFTDGSGLQNPRQPEPMPPFTSDKIRIPSSKQTALLREPSGVRISLNIFFAYRSTTVVEILSRGQFPPISRAYFVSLKLFFASAKLI